MLQSIRYGLVLQGEDYILAPLAQGQSSASAPLSSSIDISLPLTNNNGKFSWQITLNKTSSDALGTFAIGISLDTDPDHVLQTIPAGSGVVSGGQFSSTSLTELLMFNITSTSNLIRFQWTGTATTDTVEFILNYQFEG